MLNAYPHRTTSPDSQAHLIRIEGAGSSDPTVHLGPGVTVTRTGTGAYTISWDDNPGVFLGVVSGLQASTVGDVAGYTVVFDEYSSSSLAFAVTDETDSSADLGEDEYLTIWVMFSTSSVGAV